MPKSTQWALFFVLATLGVIAIALLLLYKPIKHYLYKHNAVKSYYHKVKRVVYDNDFYLINSFANQTSDYQEFHIDHIVIGDKYIYCIRDRYFPGALLVKETDPSWIFYKGKKSKYVQNPLALNRLRVQRLSLMSGIPESHFISIVLINDDCLLSDAKMSTNNNFLVSLKMFPKLIKELESRNVSPLNKEATAKLALDLDRFNLDKGK